jgi:hypothetical protein
MRNAQKAITSEAANDFAASLAKPYSNDGPKKAMEESCKTLLRVWV